MVDNLGRSHHDYSVGLDFESTLGVNGRGLGSELEYSHCKKPFEGPNVGRLGVLEAKAEALRSVEISLTGRGQPVSRWGKVPGSIRVLGATARIPARVVFPIYLCVSIPEPPISHDVTRSYHSLVRASRHFGRRMSVNGNSRNADVQSPFDCLSPI